MLTVNRLPAKPRGEFDSLSSLHMVPQLSGQIAARRIHALISSLRFTPSLDCASQNVQLEFRIFIF